jgi:hypothetical protein
MIVVQKRETRNLASKVKESPMQHSITSASIHAVGCTGNMKFSGSAPAMDGATISGALVLM